MGDPENTPFAIRHYRSSRRRRTAGDSTSIGHRSRHGAGLLAWRFLVWALSQYLCFEVGVALNIRDNFTPQCAEFRLSFRVHPPLVERRAIGADCGRWRLG
jgi:hypothetical protein